MTDAYVFEVHHESEVIQVNGRESVRAKYAFNKQSMEFSENSDPSRILLTCGRQKGEAFWRALRLSPRMSSAKPRCPATVTPRSHSEQLNALAL